MRKKSFLLTWVTIFVVAVALMYVVPLLTKSYRTVEAGIAQYAGIEKEDVVQLKTLQDDDYLYVVWENSATSEVGMTILEKRRGNTLFHPCMAMGAGETPYFGCFNTMTGQLESLIIVVCDNREGIYDHCELEMARYDGTIKHVKLSSWTVHVPVTEQVMLQVYRFPGHVNGYGYGYDHEGNPVTTGDGNMKVGW